MGQKINTFLERFKKLTKPNETVRKTVGEVIKKETTIEISIDKISLNKDIVFIDAHGAVKSKIDLKKESILV